MTETTLVTFNCPVQLLESFDKAWQQIKVKGQPRYKDRTHALTTLMEFFVEENRMEEKETQHK